MKIIWVNLFPVKPCFSRVCSLSLLKTQWKKEELLVTSNFSFPPAFFTLLAKFLPVSSSFKSSSANSFSFNPFPNKPWFLRVCSTSLLKTLWEKEKLLIASNFSFSHSVFYPFRELSAIFAKLEIVLCKLS